MNVEKKRRAVYQDVIDAPAHEVAEIIDGELVVSPRPGEPHTIVASVLQRAIGGPFDDGIDGPGGWLILGEPELHFPNGLDNDVLVPDLAGWRLERLPANTPYTTTAPDWICEVLSKSTRRIDRMKKMPIYARAGVQYAWLLHPGFRTLEVFRAEKRQWGSATVHHGDVCIGAQPFEAVPLDLARLWRRIPQPDRASEGEFAFEYEHGRTAL
jgi:Uma2 family endonuclease